MTDFDITFYAVIFTAPLYSFIWLIIDCIYRKINEPPKIDNDRYARYIVYGCSSEERVRWLHYSVHGIKPPDFLVEKWEQNQKKSSSNSC